MSRDPEIVSKNMRKIHSKDTSIEIQLRKALWHKGYRYRKNYKALPGSPDIVLTKYKIAIFCDSEFFHGKDWETLKLRLEKGKNPDYWIKKIEHNRSRDFETNKNFYFSAIQLYISGDKTSKSILMSVSRPLKRLYGILPFPMTLLNSQTNKKFVASTPIIFQINDHILLQWHIR
jgi:DNA mismatch endonuclease (patch repair protein)